MARNGDDYAHLKTARKNHNDKVDAKNIRIIRNGVNQPEEERKKSKLKKN
jgi:hypothetical protein